MKQFYSIKLASYFIPLFVFFLYFPVAAQQVARSIPIGTIDNNNITGFYEYLPAAYTNNPTAKYPIIIFLHGSGELAGPTVPLSAVLKNGIPNLIQNGTFPASFTSNNQQFSFIVITPQFINAPEPNNIYQFLNYLKTQYRIDESRIYLTGLSMGGGAVWGAISKDAEKAKQFAAALIVCGNWNSDDTPDLPGVVAKNNTPVWALHNESDPTVSSQFSKSWVSRINSTVPAPNPLAKLTIFPVSGHDAWSMAYDPVKMKKDYGMNVYEWMLQYSKGATVPPPVTPPPPATGTGKRIVVQPSSGRQIYYNDAMKNLNISPGDTLCIPAGDYEFIQFGKLAGTAEKPIVITNCGGQVRVGVNSSATAAAFVFSTCSYFKLEGTGDAGTKYGFDVNGTNKQGEKMFGLFFGDGTTDFDAHHIFVHDASMFVQAKTLQTCAHPEWLEGSFVMRNVKIHDLLCRNSTWEGFYIGNTHYLFNNGSCVDLKSHHIENLEVYNNDLENMGSDGIQIAMTDLGDNKVYNNRVVNYAIAKNSAHGYGIMSGGGSKLKIYNNRVDKGYNPGIEIFGTGINYVYNNVISNITYEGINVTDKLVFDPATAYIYNNTIYNTGVDGIKIFADLTTVGHKLYNNLVIVTGTQWDTPKMGYYIKGSNPIKVDFALDNNLSFKTAAEAGIADAANGNFRLTSSSKAINTGRDMQDLGLMNDWENTPRPQGGKYDVGAFESKDGQNNITPTANAGKDLVISLPVTTVKLDASASTDADGNIITYAWKKISGPAAGNISSPGAVTTEITGLIAGTYVFELNVADDKGVSATDLVTVTVLSSPARPPVISVGQDVTIQLPTSSIQLDGSSSYDPDGMIVKYNWSKISGPAGGTITDNTLSNTDATGMQAGTYVFQLTITNNAGTTATANMTVTVKGVGDNNIVPVANAGSNIIITLPASKVTLDGSTSKDSDGTISTWLWQKISGPGAGTISSPAASKTEVTGLAAGIYVFQLTVTDNDGATASARVTVTVNDAPAQNKPPVANAGANQTVTLPISSVTLDGSTSSDPDGTIATYAWKKISGPGAGTISSPATNTTIATGLVTGVYIFELTVTDNNGATNAARTTVIVNDAPVQNKPPVANAGTNQTVTLPISSVTLDGSSSSDPDGTIATYAWRKISGPGAGTINSSATNTTIVTGLITGVYIFELTVTDNNGATNAARTTVTVNDAPAQNKPPVANAGTNQTVTLPISSVTLDGSSSSDPDGTIATYAWKKISGPGAGTISSPATNTTIVTGLVTGVYIFELTVTDNKGATNAARTTVTVNDAPAKQPPVALAGPTRTVTLPFSFVTLDGTASYDPDGTIASYFWSQVNGPSNSLITGADNAIAQVSELKKGVYIFKLLVKDNDGLASSTNTSIIVNDSDVHPPQDSVIHVELYPSRVTGSQPAKLVVSNPTVNTVWISIYNIKGMLEMTASYPLNGTFSTNLDLGSLETGIHIINVKGDNGYKWAGKVVKY
ncbi:PKD domain-containing protein [Chitinophaga sp. MM2321]|uniref:PKD domain-containing protein n=1 Tax=Chitinophaga sp. MM2321 TaxID=3137178 RepID=UPI0032D56CE9